MLLRHQLGGKEAEVLQLQSDGMYKDERIRQLQHQLELTVAAAATHLQLLQSNNHTNTTNTLSSAGYTSSPLPSSSSSSSSSTSSLPSTAINAAGGAGAVSGSGMVFNRPPSILTTPIPSGQPHPSAPPPHQPPPPQPSLDVVSMQLTLAAHNVQLSTVGLMEARRERDEMEAKALAHAQQIAVLQTESAAKVTPCRLKYITPTPFLNCRTHVIGISTSSMFITTSPPHPTFTLCRLQNYPHKRPNFDPNSNDWRVWWLRLENRLGRLARPLLRSRTAVRGRRCGSGRWR